MRTLAFATIASFAALAVAACGTAPDGTDTTASTTQAIMTCPAGTTPKCTGFGTARKCQCLPYVQQQPTCTYVAPSSSGTAQYIESWAVASPDGTCPDIPATEGTWKNLQPIDYGSFGFDGVPCERRGLPVSLATCTSIPELASQPCCTYVWWPNGFVAPSPWVAQGLAPQEACSEVAVSYALCTHPPMTLYPIVAGLPCDPLTDPGCGGGGGSDCSSCAHY